MSSDNFFPFWTSFHHVWVTSAGICPVTSWIICQKMYSAIAINLECCKWYINHAKVNNEIIGQNHQSFNYEVLLRYFRLWWFWNARALKRLKEESPSRFYQQTKNALVGGLWYRHRQDVSGIEQRSNRPSDEEIVWKTVNFETKSSTTSLSIWETTKKFYAVLKAYTVTRWSSVVECIMNKKSS